MFVTNVWNTCTIEVMTNDESVNVTITLPRVVHDKWAADKKRKGLIARLVAEHYGFIVNKSRVVEKTSGV